MRGRMAKVGFIAAVLTVSSGLLNPCYSLEGCELELVSKRFPQLLKNRNLALNSDEPLNQENSWILRIPKGHQASLYLLQVPPTHLMNILQVSLVNATGTSAAPRALFLASEMSPTSSWGPTVAKSADVYLLLTAWHSIANPPSGGDFFQSIIPSEPTNIPGVLLPPALKPNQNFNGTYLQSLFKISGLDLLGADDGGDSNGPDWDDFAVKIGCGKTP